MSPLRVGTEGGVSGLESDVAHYEAVNGARADPAAWPPPCPAGTSPEQRRCAREVTVPEPQH